MNLIDKFNMHQTLKKVADKNNTTFEEVYSEIAIAIDTALASDDPEAKALWEKVPKKGEKPTPEELILFLTKMLSENK